MAIKRIAPSGGDYTTIQAWFDSLPAVLTEPEIGEVESFDNAEVLTQLGYGVHNTTAANYIELRAAAGHEFDPATKTGARIRSGASGTHIVLNVSGVDFRLTNFGVIQENTSGPANGVVFVGRTGGNQIIVRNCYIEQKASNGTLYALLGAYPNLNLTVENSIIVSNARICDMRGAASGVFRNCTFWRRNDQLGFLADSATTVINCYSGKAGGTQNDWWSSGTYTGQNNASSDTTAEAKFTSSINSVAGADAFTSVTSGSEVFTLKAGSALVDQGATIGEITDDIAGTSRPQGTAYDIGAYEQPLAGDPPQGTVTIISVDPADTSVVVTYSYNDTDETGYEYRLNGGAAATLGASPATISGLTASTEYDLEVRAINGSGAGAWSAVSTFTTGALTLPSLTVTEPLVNNTGSVLANGTDIKIAVLQESDLVSVHTATVSTDAQGMLPAIEDNSLVPGQQYLVVILTSGGGVGVSQPITAI